MPRKGENIYVRKDGRWEGRYIKERTPDGKCRYGYVYARSYRETREKLAAGRAAAGVQVRSHTGSPGTAAKKATFGEIACDWLDCQQYKVKESTRIKYWNLLNRHVLPEFGEIPWKRISRESIESFCNRLLLTGGREGKGLSSKTVSDILSVIRSIFRYASANGYPLPCDCSSITIRQNAGELRILSHNEQSRLCRYLYNNINGKNIGILISLFAGLRIGEVCALRWEDISVREQTIYVHRTMQRLQTGYDTEKKTEIRTTAPKSRCSIRRIPIPDSLAALLSAYREGKCGYVLTGEEKTFVEPRTMQRYFQTVLREAAIEQVNYHALRHTFATRCVEMNFDVKTLSEILGHANVSITMNRYVHPSMEMKRESMQRLSSLLTVS